MSFKLTFCKRLTLDALVIKARTRVVKVSTLVIRVSTLLIKFSTLVTMMSLVPSAFAGEKENNIIDKAINAYGGEKLLTLRNLRYVDTIDHFFSHQSGHSMQGPTSQHLNQIQLEVSLDLENQRSEFKRLTKLIVGYHDSRNLTASHRIFKDGIGYNVDHFLEEYQVSNRIDLGNTDLGFSQMLDPLIVKKLESEKKNAEWVDTAYIQGKAHDVLTVNADTPNEYSVYIDKESGLLSRMLQKRGPNLRSYNFLQHQNLSGIAWAKQLLVGTKDFPIYHSNNRHVVANITQAHSFNVPAHYKKSKPVTPVDVSTLTIRKLADGVFYAGQDWGYTLFIDTGEYYISAGAWGMSDRSDDWKKALNLLNATTGNRKPVKYHLVSHHHTDHMSELNDVLEHGAQILVHPTDIESVRQFLAKREIKDDQFKVIDKNTTLADAKVFIFDAPNSQASHNLSIYLPEHQIVFAEDIFGSSFQNQHHSPRSWPHMDTYQRLSGFVNRLKALNLEVKQYVSSHHQRVLNQKEINEALKTKLPEEQVIMKRLFSDGDRKSQAL